MQPIVKWQYEKLEGTLGLLEDHLADPDCPCHSAGENCARKHLKRTEDYCAETMIILARDTKSSDKEFDQLVKLAEEARAYRKAEESLLCGKKPKPEELCPVSWASKWRKYFETLLVWACNLMKIKDSGITYKEHIPLPMIINQGKPDPDEGIIPSKYRDFQVELNLVRSPNWSIDKAPQLNSFDKVQDLLGLMRKQDREWVMLILLDTRLRLVGVAEFAIGTSDTALVSVLEVARMTLKTNASSVIVVHNHPAGDPSPSDADRRLYHRLKESLEKLEIQVPEFIVVGHKSDFSMQAGYTLPAPNYQQSGRVEPYPDESEPTPTPPQPKPMPELRPPVGIHGQGRLFQRKLKLADPVAESYIKISGKCGKDEGKVCNFKVQGIDKVEATTPSIKELGTLISQIAARPDLSIRKRQADQNKTSNKTWAVGTTTTTRYEFE